MALALATSVLGLPLWWITGHSSLTIAVGYGSHLFADMMTLGGVQLFWPSRLIAVFPGRDEYRVVSGGNSEKVFVALTLLCAILFYPVSRVGFDGLIYRLGGSDQLYGKVIKVTDGDTITVETGGRGTPVRLIGVDTPETVAPDQPIGCYGKEANAYTKKVLAMGSRFNSFGESANVKSSEPIRGASNLRKGRIENPGFEKLKAIALRPWVSLRSFGSKKVLSSIKGCE